MIDRPRILIVDDNIEMGRILRDQLLREQYRVECVHSAPAALSRLALQSYDLVMTDMMMPGMSGIDLLRKIREADSDLPVIVFTGRESFESEIEAANLRVSDVFTKSMISRQDLVDAVERALYESPPD